MKKIFVVLIVFLALVVPNVKVDALEDSFYEGEYISGEYMKKFKNGATSGKYQQMRVFRRKSDDSAVYCIELWEKLRSNVVLNGYDIKQYSYANIDYSTWEKIMLISYYGYGYGDHTDIKWYAITQFMIWKETSPDSNIYFTDKLNGNKIDKYENEMEEIYELIKNHGKLPSFNGDTYELSYNKSLTITDTNKVLKNFNITGYSDMEIKKVGNKLTVTKKRPGLSTLTFVNNGMLYNRKPVVYIDNNGQDVLLPGNYDQVMAKASFYLYSSTIIINKKDLGNDNNISQGDAKLNGAKIQLLDLNKKLVQEKTVASDNKIIFENVPYGYYYLREVSPGEGYLLNDDLISVKVDKNREEIDFYNEVIENKIVFNKYFSNYLSNDINPESGAMFTIFNSSDKEIMTFVTDNNGHYETILPYGKYVVRQIFGKKNYVYVEDFIIEIREDGKTQTFNLYNEQITANVKLINIDIDSKLPILEGGALFRIRNVDTLEIVIDNLMTDDFGSTNVITLASGKYQVEQTASVDKYLVNNSIFEFEISDEANYEMVDGNNYIEILIPNEKLKTKIEVEKTIEYYLNDKLIKTENDNNLEILIYAKEDIFTKDGLKIYDKDQEVDVIKLVDNKVTSSYLIAGLYYFKNPIDNTLIEVVLDSISIKKVELIDRVFEYEEVIDKDEDDMVIEEEMVDIDIKDNYVMIEVPDTFSSKAIFSSTKIYFLLISLFLMGKKKYESN